MLLIKGRRKKHLKKVKSLQKELLIKILIFLFLILNFRTTQRLLLKKGIGLDKAFKFAANGGFYDKILVNKHHHYVSNVYGY